MEKSCPQVKKQNFVNPVLLYCTGVRIVFCLSSGMYELDLMSVKPARGFYTISIIVVPQKADKRYIGTSGAEVSGKVNYLVSSKLSSLIWKEA